MRKFSPHVTAVFVSLLLFSLGQVAAQSGSRSAAPAAISTAFTYQGRLMSGNGPASGSYPMTFRLFDAASGGAQVGVALTQPVSVTGGLFTTQLDFGAGVFAGGPRWLAITVSGTDLNPRQPLTAAPYALYAPQAGQATTAQTATLALAAQTAPWSGLSGVPADLADGDQVGLTSVGWTDVLSRPAGLDDGDDNTTYTAGKGLAMQGTQFHAQGSAISNTLIVAKGGGDFTSIQAALNSITTASVNNPFLVYVATGVYTEQVTLKPYVTLEGAGQDATIIRWTGGSLNPDSNSNSATVISANNAALRHVTLESDGTGKTYAIGLYSMGATARIDAITVRATGGASSYGVYTAASSPIMRHITASGMGQADSYGIYNTESSPTMSHITASATGGLRSYGIYNDRSSPTMSSITASATNSGRSLGIYNVASSPRMNDVTATAMGTNQTFAINNYGASSPTMINVVATAVGTLSRDNAFNIGILNQDNAAPTMRNVIATAAGTFLSIGILSNNASMSIRDSFVSGTVASVSHEVGVATVANSQLVGPVSPGIICFDNYDANLAAITCEP